MIKLYGNGPSRWVKPYWVLRELGVEFEPVLVRIQQGEHRSPEHLQRNPFGKLPVLEDGDFRLCESSAICSYLVDRDPSPAARALAPAPGTRERALVDQWVSFAVTELEQPLWRIMKHRMVYPEKQRIPSEIGLACEDFQRLATTLEPMLARHHIVDDRFTLADLTIAYTLRWSRFERMLGVDLLARFPRLQAYVEKHTSRAAFPRELYG